MLAAELTVARPRAAALALFTAEGERRWVGDEGRAWLEDFAAGYADEIAEWERLIGGLRAGD